MKLKKGVTLKPGVKLKKEAKDSKKTYPQSSRKYYASKSKKTC